MIKEISFTKVTLPYGWLGNMSPHPTEYDGFLYRTAEALFQALRFDDLGIRSAIRSERSPMMAKRLAKRYWEQMILIPCGSSDVDNMQFVLEQKLAQHPALKPLLLETGDALLIEDCTARPHGSGLFWGMRRAADGWQGENQLGKLWMKLRDRCRHDC